MRVQDVSISAGFGWIKEAFKLYGAQPLNWMSLVSAWLLLCFVMALIPLVGLPLVVMLQPAFYAGFVLACRDQEMGKTVGLAHLFAGFSTTGRTLVQLGAIIMLVQILAQMLISALGMDEVTTVIAKQFTEQKTITPEMLKAALKGKEWLLALGVVLALLIDYVFWFSAAVMAHQPMRASHAIRWSFYAMIANPLPLIVFGALLVALLFVAGIFMGIARFLGFIGLFVFLVIFAISHYTSFKSVFAASADEKVTPAPDETSGNA